MSATGRSDVRRKDDHYVTPAWCVKAIWPKLGAFDSCLDPCAGEGRLLMTLQDLASSPMYRGIELDEERATLCATQNGIGCLVGDALQSEYLYEIWRTPIHQKPYDLIITNPPYSLALEFLKAALASGASEVCMLLRLNFLGSQERAKFWRENPCDVYVLPKRPSFAWFYKCQFVGCLWAESFPVGVEKKACPKCGGDLKKTTSDATEYAWFHFTSWKRKNCAQGRGHWEILRVDP